MLTLAEHLSACGYNPVFIFPKENSADFAARCTELGFPFRTVRLSRITKEIRVAIRYVFCSWLEVLYLVLLLRREAPDLVYVAGGSWQFKAALSAKLAGKRFVWHLNDTYVPKFIHFAFKLIARFARGFVCASGETLGYYKIDLPKGKPVKVISSPIDLEKFSPSVRSATDFYFDESKFHIMTVANISPVKDLETLISVADLVAQDEKAIHFLVLGPVFSSQLNYFNSISERIRKKDIKNVTFLGPKSYIVPYLHNSDVYLCTSRNESSPISVWEAMATGLPLVSTRVGDIPNFAESEQAALLADVGNAKLLAQHIVFLYRNPGYARLLRHRSRRVAESNFSAARCAEFHMEFFTKILNASPRKS